jgi:hypothetical protein
MLSGERLLLPLGILPTVALREKTWTHPLSSLFHSVTGQLPESIVEDLEARGITVHSRETDD